MTNVKLSSSHYKESLTFTRNEDNWSTQEWLYNQHDQNAGLCFWMINVNLYSSRSWQRASDHHQWRRQSTQERLHNLLNQNAATAQTTNSLTFNSDESRALVSAGAVGGHAGVLPFLVHLGAADLQPDVLIIVPRLHVGRQDKFTPVPKQWAKK